MRKMREETRSNEHRRTGKYKMRTFARLTGFSPTLLRAWERRHGLLRPERQQGKHRLYTDEDLQVMRSVKRRMASGAAIGEIAARGRKQLLAAGGGDLRSADEMSRSPAHDTHPLEHLAAKLVQAAVDLDTEVLKHSIDHAFSLVSPKIAIERVVQPAMAEIGSRWADGTLSIAGEHLVSNELRSRLHRILDPSRSRTGSSQVAVCACLPDEDHELGLLTIALYLAQDGLDITYLGARVPISDVAHVADTVGAVAVCLSATTRQVVESCQDELISLAERCRGRRQVHLGGQGVTAGVISQFAHTPLRVWPANTRLAEVLQSVSSGEIPRNLKIV